jgi:hypothetical protein
MRLAEERTFDETVTPEGLRRVIARAAESVDFATLKGKLTASAARVRAHFAAIVDSPAAALARAAPAETATASKEALP